MSASMDASGSKPPARWRIVLATVFTLLATGVIVIAAHLLSRRAPAALPVQNLINALLCLGGIVLALKLIAGRWAHLPPEALGTRVDPGAWRPWMAGLLLGLCLGPVAFLIALVQGAFEVQWVGPDLSAWALLGTAALATAIHALFEEVAFRGGLVGILRQRFPPAAAVLVPALVFGVVHLVNAGASALGALNTTLVGAAFGFLYLAGQRPSLALVAGLHFGWNEVLAHLGVPVSGTVEAGAFLMVKPAATIWSGLAYGLEASPATTIVFTCLLGVSWWRTGRPRAASRSPCPGE